MKQIPKGTFTVETESERLANALRAWRDLIDRRHDLSFDKYSDMIVRHEVAAGGLDGAFGR